MEANNKWGDVMESSSAVISSHRRLNFNQQHLHSQTFFLLCKREREREIFLIKFAIKTKINSIIVVVLCSVLCFCCLLTFLFLLFL